MQIHEKKTNSGRIYLKLEKRLPLINGIQGKVMSEEDKWVSTLFLLFKFFHWASISFAIKNIFSFNPQFKYGSKN